MIIYASFSSLFINLSIMIYLLYLNQRSSELKYYDILTWSGIIVLLPGFQLAGHTTPFLSAYWNAWTSLYVSSTLRPTCSSLIVTDRITPFPSIIISPLSEAP